MSLLFRFHFCEEMHTFLLFSHIFFFYKTKPTLRPLYSFHSYIPEFYNITQRWLSFSQCSCTELHCVDADPCSFNACMDRDQFNLSSVCGHGGSGYICCLATLCQALEIKARPTLASGNSERDLYNKQPSLSPRGRTDPLNTRGTYYQEEMSHTEWTQ